MQLERRLAVPAPATTKADALKQSLHVFVGKRLNQIEVAAGLPWWQTGLVFTLKHNL